MYPSNSQVNSMDGEKRRSHNDHDGDREAEGRRRRDYGREDDRYDRRDRRDRDSRGQDRHHHHKSRHEDRERRRNRSRSRSKERRHRRRSSSSDSDDQGRDQKEERSISSGRNPSPPRANANNYLNHGAASKNDRIESSTSRFPNHGFQGQTQAEYAASQNSVGVDRSNHSKASNSASGITIKLAPPPPPKPSLPVALAPTLVQKSSKIAAIFNDDDDDEPEEMPPECKMRMKNVGRDTPTSAGPNSFGKTKLGFCNTAHLGDPKLESPVGRNAPTKLPKWK